MSFFGGSNMQNRQQAINPQNIALAEQELEMVTDLFNSQGESVCIDRCVAKFIEVNTKVGEKMQKMGQQQ
ncbi:hypothetical protein BY458DRAFT_524289 [Sporodiniella umbellata]|nr:hypothetical protein BY458DRAFT_524289 [Sporodiniella umbellata]